MYVVDFLRKRRVWFETFLHRPASTATRLAGHLHVPGRSVAKSVLVKAREDYVLALLPATSQVELALLAEALGSEPGEIRLATCDEIERIFHDCEPGAIPPFGRIYGLQTVVDAGLREESLLIFRTNTRHLSMKMQFCDYANLEKPIEADFARPIAPGMGQPPQRPRQRRAG